MNLKKHLVLMEKNGPWLAKKVGVSHQSVYNWLNGKDKPSPENLKKLAKTLAIPQEKLYTHFHKA